MHSNYDDDDSSSVAWNKEEFFKDIIEDDVFESKETVERTSSNSSEQPNRRFPSNHDSVDVVKQILTDVFVEDSNEEIIVVYILDFLSEHAFEKEATPDKRFPNSSLPLIRNYSDNTDTSEGSLVVTEPPGIAQHSLFSDVSEFGSQPFPTIPITPPSRKSSLVWGYFDFFPNVNSDSVQTTSESLPVSKPVLRPSRSQMRDEIPTIDAEETRPEFDIALVVSEPLVYSDNSDINPQSSMSMSHQSGCLLETIEEYEKARDAPVHFRQFGNTLHGMQEALRHRIKILHIAAVITEEHFILEDSEDIGLGKEYTPEKILLHPENVKVEVLVLCGCEQNPSALKLAKKFAKECRVQHAVLIPRPEDGRNHKDQQRDQKLFLTDFYRCILRGKTVKGAFYFALTQISRKAYRDLFHLWAPTKGLEIHRRIIFPKLGDFFWFDQNEEMPRPEVPLMSKFPREDLHKHFMGRNKAMFDILQIMKTKQMVYIYGAKGMGKTTVMKEICNYCRARRQYDAFYYFDFEDIFQKRLEWLHQKLVHRNIFEYSIYKDAQTFYDSLRAWCEGKKIVFVFDHILDLVSDYKQERELADFLFGFTQRLGDNIKILVASRHKFSKLNHLGRVDYVLGGLDAHTLGLLFLQKVPRRYWVNALLSTGRFSYFVDLIKETDVWKWCETLQYRPSLVDDLNKRLRSCRGRKSILEIHEGDLSFMKMEYTNKVTVKEKPAAIEEFEEEYLNERKRGDIADRMFVNHKQMKLGKLVSVFVQVAMDEICEFLGDLRGSHNFNSGKPTDAKVWENEIRSKVQKANQYLEGDLMDWLEVQQMRFGIDWKKKIKTLRKDDRNFQIYRRLYRHFFTSFRVVFALGRWYWDRRVAGIFHGWVEKGRGEVLLKSLVQKEIVKRTEGVVLFRFSSQPGCFAIEAYAENRDFYSLLVYALRSQDGTPLGTSTNHVTRMCRNVLEKRVKSVSRQS